MSNLEQNISDAILNSIDVIINKRLSELNYSETIKGIIIDDSKASKGVYSVRYETSIFDAYTKDTSLKKGDLVQILISSKNSSDTKIILNKIVNEENEFLAQNEYDKYIDVTKNLLDVILDTNKNLLANSNYEEKLLWSNTSTHDFSRYTKLNLEANFQCLLQNAENGNYGLRIEITHDNTILNLYFKNNEMLGNSLNYVGFTPQRKIFDLKNFNIQNITNISLFFYQEKGSFLDSQKKSIPYQDSFKNNLPSNIFIDDIKLSFGFFSDELEIGVDSISIAPAEGYSLSYEVEPENAIVELNWLHWNDDNSKLLTKEDIIKDNRYHIEWYKYQLYDDAVQAIKIQREKKIEDFAGIESEERLDLIEASLIENLGCPHLNNNNWQRLYAYDDNFSCEVILDGDASTQEQIRAFAYFTDSTNISQSNIITFEGENPANPKISTKKQGAYLTLSDDSNGEYYLYTETNILDHEDKKTRILTVSYYTADGEEVDLLDSTEYSIEWIGPDPEKKSMLTNCQPGNKKTEYIYNIASQYNPNALENTISCKVIYSNENQSFNNYVVEQKFNFGYANSANTEKNLIIDFQNKNLQYNNVSYSKNALQFSSIEPETFILKNINTLGFDNNNEEEDIMWHLAFYPVATTGQKTIINATILENEATLPEKTDTYQLVTYSGKEDVVYLIPPTEGFNFNNYLILCASVGTAAVEFPIAISFNQYEYNYITGANYILYRQLGIPIYNKEPYNIYDHNGNEIEGNFVWEYKGDNWYSISTFENNKALLIPSQVYLEEHGPIGVLCKKDNEIVWCQSITVSESAFASNTLSQWDGQSVQINDNSVTAPMIMAGKKEEDENHNIKFTGVMMGDLQADTNDALPLTGLYGFRKGNPSFGFTEEGTGFIGEAGIGRIEFDGRHGWITSGDFSTLKETIVYDNPVEYYTTTSFLDLTSQGVKIEVPNIINNQIQYLNLIFKLGDSFFVSKESILDENEELKDKYNVYVKGNLTATTLMATESGQIASFLFNDTYLYSIDYENNSSVFLGNSGFFLGGVPAVIDDQHIVPTLNFPFYVLKDGTFKATKGSIAGWDITQNMLYKQFTIDNVTQTFYLDTSSDNNTGICFGNNFIVLKNGTVKLANLLLEGTLQFSSGSSVKNLFILRSESKGYKIKKNIDVIIKLTTVSGYYPILIAKITTGHNHVVKITGYQIYKSGSFYYAKVSLSQHPRTTQMSGTLTLSILHMRIGSGDNLIDLFEEDSSVMPTEPDEIEDDNNQGDGDNSYLIISGDGDTISGAGLAATNTFTGINYFNNTVYFNNNNTNNVYLYYHGSEVLTRSDLSESGGFNFGSKAGLNSDNVFSGSNRFSNKLYYGTSSNTNTEVATHQWVNNQNYATETWVTNNYCEVNGPTIQDIKDRLTALENA